MFALYTLLIHCYHFCLRVVSPVSKKASLFIAGRNGQDFLKIRALWPDKRIVIIHAASYGEFEMSRPLITYLQKRSRDMRFVVVFFSPSGYERIELDERHFYKIYLPKDSLSNQEKMLKQIKPEAYFFIKYEFWFNLLRALNNNKIPYYFMSLHMPEEHYLFKPIMKPFLDCLRKAERIFTHSENSTRILNEKGFRNVSSFGDLRVPQVIRNKAESNIEISWKNPNLKCMVWGSITRKELKPVVHCIKSLPAFNHILALHDIESKELRFLESKLPSISLYSSEKTAIEQLLVVDTYGDLKHLYKYADIAYVGAGFEKGPHNIMEPMIFGASVIIGPNITKFPFAQLAVHEGFAYKLEHLNQLKEAILSEAENTGMQDKKARIDFLLSMNPEMNVIDPFIKF